MNSFEIDEAFQAALKRKKSLKDLQSEHPHGPLLEPNSPESRDMTARSQKSKKPDGFRGIGIDIYGKPIIRTQSKPFGRRKP